MSSHSSVLYFVNNRIIMKKKTNRRYLHDWICFSCCKVSCCQTVALAISKLICHYSGCFFASLLYILPDISFGPLKLLYSKKAPEKKNLFIGPFENNFKQGVGYFEVSVQAIFHSLVDSPWGLF